MFSKKDYVWLFSWQINTSFTTGVCFINQLEEPQSLMPLMLIWLFENICNFLKLSFYSMALRVSYFFLRGNNSLCRAQGRCCVVHKSYISSVCHHDFNIELGFHCNEEEFEFCQFQ